LLYEYETWAVRENGKSRITSAIRENGKSRITSAEMKFMRTAKYSWQDYNTNEDI
jgi:hypothetical protein